MEIKNKLVKSPYIRFHKKDIYRNALLSRYQVIRENEMEILQDCTQPKSVQYLNENYDSNLVDKLINHKLLLDSACVWEQSNITQLEIETSTVCNWNCEFCPQTYYPRIPQFMDLNLFCKILDNAVDYGKIQYVTINSYNEPTLSPLFYQYTSEIAKRNFKLILFTNGSHLDEDKIAHLQRLGNTRNVVVNLPSIHSERFHVMTGSNDYDNTISTIHKLLKYGIRAGISLQGKGRTLIKEMREIQRVFPDIRIDLSGSNDRAGSLHNHYWQNIQILKPLYGCEMINRCAVITVNGDLCLCCNDFHRSKLYGNIKKESLIDILKSQQIMEYRKKIWGFDTAEPDFICRKCYYMIVSAPKELD